MAINIQEVTNNVTTSADNIVEGSGIFDDLMETVTKHITAQYKLGRITGTEYATVYLGAIQATLAEAMKFTLEKGAIDADIALKGIQGSEAEANGLSNRTEAEANGMSQRTEAEATGTSDRELKGSQKLLVDAQKATEAEKALLVTRQAKGFDDDAKQKLLKQALDSWSVAYSVAKDDNGIPDSITVDSIDNIMKTAMDSLGIPSNLGVNTNPLNYTPPPKV